MSGDGGAMVTDPVSAPLPAGHHETEPDRLTERGCSTDDDGPGWLHLLVADDAITERHHMTLCGAVLASSELPSSLCLDDCKRDHVYCLACLRVANEHNWNLGVDVDCPPGVIVRRAR